MNFGVYGCRHLHIAEAVAELLALGHHCVGVYEPEGVQVERLLEQQHIPRLPSSERLFSKNPELMLCAAINSQKIAIIEECERRGIPVMLDKPAITCRDGYQRLEWVIRRGKIKVGMMLTERFNPAILALRQAISEGLLGKVVSLSFAKPHRLSPESRDSWHFDKAQNGGPILDLMIHDFDLLRVLTHSEIETCVSYLGLGNRTGYPDFYDDAKALCCTESGVTALLTADWWTPQSYPIFGNGRIVCTGTEGRCEVYTTGDPLLHPSPCAILSSRDCEQQILENRQPARTLMEEFLSYLSGEESEITGEDILKASLASLLADEGAKIVTVKGN